MQHRSRPRSWRRGCLRVSSRFLIVLFVLMNVVAWVQARALTTFVSDGPFPQGPQSVSVGTLVYYAAVGIPVPRPQNRHTPADHFLPFETVQIAMNDSEWLEAWYVPQQNQRGVVLLFSGYANKKEAVLTPAAHFHQLGYGSLLVDVRGSGGSSGNDTTIGLREADDVAAAMAYAQERWPGQPIVLYGISMGGAAILRAVAINGIRPAAVIIEGVFDRLLTTARHRFDAAGLPGSPASELLLLWGSVQMGYNGFAHNPVAYAAAVDVPTLVMGGGQDRWVLPAETQGIVDALRGPKQLVVFDHAGHAMPFVHHDEGRWVEVVRSFLP